MATPSLPPKFYEKDTSRLYSLRLGTKELFKFIIPVSKDKIIIIDGDEKFKGKHLVAEDLDNFLDDHFIIEDIGEAPIMASVKTAAHREQTAAERANAFIRSQAEKAARANATNENNPFKIEHVAGKNNSKKPESLYDMIYYFGLENVPKKQLKVAIHKINFFFKMARDKTGEKTNIYRMNNIIIANLLDKYIRPYLDTTPININAKVYSDPDNYKQNSSLFSIFVNELREKIDSILIGPNNTFSTQKPKQNSKLNIKINSKTNSKTNSKINNSTALENLDSWLLENNSRPDRGGGAGMGGGRRKRHTKRRFTRRHRTRRH